MLVCRQPKTSNFIEKAAFTVVDFHPRMLFSMDFFLEGVGGGGGGSGGVGQHWCKTTFLQNYLAQITKIIKFTLAKWKRKLIANCSELSFEITLLGL